MMTITVNEMIKILQQIDEKDRDLPLEVHQRRDDEGQIEEIFSCFSEKEGDVLVTHHEFPKYEIEIKKDNSDLKVCKNDGQKVISYSDQKTVVLSVNHSPFGFHVENGYYEQYKDLLLDWYQDNPDSYKASLQEIN